MPNKLMDEDQLKQWILRRLGAPFWKVELSFDQLEDAIEGARRWFSAKKGVKRQLYLPLFSGVTSYVLPDQVDTVLDVAFGAGLMDPSAIFSPYVMMDQQIPYNMFTAGGSTGLYSTYTQTMQYIEVAKTMLNAEPDWRQEDRILFVFPRPRGGGNALIDYKSHDFTVEQLNERDHDLVKRYALAWAKRDLGGNRTKYPSLPGAQESTTLNGQQLLGDAEKDFDKLETEIAASAYPMGFLAG